MWILIRLTTQIFGEPVAMQLSCHHKMVGKPFVPGINDHTDPRDVLMIFPNFEELLFKV